MEHKSTFDDKICVHYTTFAFITPLSYLNVNTNKSLKNHTRCLVESSKYVLKFFLAFNCEYYVFGKETCPWGKLYGYVIIIMM